MISIFWLRHHKKSRGDDFYDVTYSEIANCNFTSTIRYKGTIYVLDAINGGGSESCWSRALRQ